MFNNLFENKRGFSLAELLVVVSMTIVLASAAFLSVGSMQNKYNQLALENYAQNIYETAQENITLLKKTGSWNDLLEENKTNMSFFGEKINTKPSDYDYWLEHSFANGESPDALTYDNVKDNLYYFSSTNANIKNLLLPKGSVADELASEGEFFVEYNIDTASIYSVWYTSNKVSGEYQADICEELNNTGRPNSDINSSSASAARKAYKKGDKKSPYGYYCGGLINRDIFIDLETPQVKVINGEDLILQIKDKNCGRLIGYDNDILNIKITGLTSGNSIVYKVERGAPYSLRSSNPAQTMYNITANVSDEYIVYNVILDSITSPRYANDPVQSRENFHFANVCPNLTPGEDIEITVTASSLDNKSNPKSKTVKTNSLYNKTSGNDYYISQLRHLENMDNRVSGNTNITDANIHFLRNISFDGEGTGLKHTKDYTSLTITQYSGLPLSVRSGNYVPVNIDGNVNVDNQSPNNHALVYNIRIKLTSDLNAYIGLFGQVGIGETKTVTINDIGVVSNTSTGSSLKTIFEANNIYSAGGLVGHCGGTLNLTNCFSTIQISELARTSNSVFGGLVGYAKQANISNCYVSGTLGEDENVEENTFSPYWNNITSCIDGATDTTNTTQARIGGLVGWTTTATITNSYATTSIGIAECHNTYLGGLAGYVNSATITNSYFAGAINATGEYSEQVTIGGLANGNISASNSWYLNNCLTTSIYHQLNNTEGDAVAYNDKVVESAVTSFPYNRTDNSEFNLPDVTGLGHHYGDWGDVSINEEFEIPAHALVGKLGKDVFQSFLSGVYDANDLTEIRFVNTGASRRDGNDGSSQTSAYDVSEEQNGSVLAWCDGSIVYVSNALADTKVEAPADCRYLFTDGSTTGWQKNINYIDLSHFDTQNTTDTGYMFYATGYSVNSFSIYGLNDLNMSSVTSTSNMFGYAGYSASSWSIGDISGWCTDSVTDMNRMFYSAGYETSDFSLGNLGEWNVSNVTDMTYMFSSCGRNALSWYVGDLGTWTTNSLQSTHEMFSDAAYSAENVSVGNLGNWNTYNITDMSNMFTSFGYNAQNVNIGDLSTWNTYNVKNMERMFTEIAYNSTTFKMGDISLWVTSNVENMDYLFYYASYMSSYTLDLSSWDVSNVTTHTNFNNGLTSRITIPSAWN